MENVFCLEFLAEDYAYKRFHQYGEVHSQRMVLEVIEVELETFEHFLHGVGISVIQRGV